VKRCTIISDYARPPLILRLNIAGTPIDWVSWQHAVCLYARGMVVWTVGDPVLQIRGGSAKADGRQSSFELYGIIACEGRIVQQQKMVPPLTNEGLFRRDRGICLYCGGAFSDFELTRDHIIPYSRGGRNNWDNVVASCKRCNHHKGDRLIQDCGMELLALPYEPNFSEYLALINSGRILGDQMEFLSKNFNSDSRIFQ